MKDDHKELNDDEELNDDDLDNEMTEDMARTAVGKKIIPKTEKRLLKHQFTEEEKKEIAEEMARSVSQRDRVEAEKKSIVSQLTSQKKICEASISQCGEQINSGYEYREISCKVFRDFENKWFTVTRNDTGEIVESRKMRSSELQMSIEEE